ncbi:MFS transporter [Streptomyces sp. NPDC030920]|uniref:MFS transporter n=1 Tax=Streptomyces sp. NPDC030920 TaxID=3365308 RepID=UPI00384FBCB2
MLIAGPLADRRGRRRAALAALALKVLSTLLLMVGGAWGGTWLLPGRFLTGVSAGALLAAGSAWTKELSDSPRQLARWTARFWTAAYLGLFTPCILILLGHVTTTLLPAAVTLLALAHAVFRSHQVERPARRRTP